MRKNQWNTSRAIAVYRRDDVDSKRLHFAGWATTKQTMAEVAGKFLPLKTDFWRRTVRANGCLIVEYYKPTIEEQAEWAGRWKLSDQRNPFRVQSHIAHREPEHVTA